MQSCSNNIKYWESHNSGCHTHSFKCNKPENKSVKFQLLYPATKYALKSKKWYAFWPIRLSLIQTKTLWWKKTELILGKTKQTFSENGTFKKILYYSISTSRKDGKSCGRPVPLLKTTRNARCKFKILCLKALKILNSLRYYKERQCSKKKKKKGQDSVCWKNRGSTSRSPNCQSWNDLNNKINYSNGF